MTSKHEIVEIPSSTIPEAAWARPIGQPHENPSHSRVPYPIIDDGSYNGAPLGGIGAGTIGRTFRGDFARWHLDIGRHDYRPIPADMFSLFVHQGDETTTQALWTHHPEDGSLSAWKWDYPVGAGMYYALYPRSWFVYDRERSRIELTCEQFSPILPHNYRESSYPVALFNWTARNPGDQPVTVGLMFTWEDWIGGGGHSLQQRDAGGQAMRGVVMQQGAAGTMAIAALETPGVTVSYRSRFVSSGDGADVWNDFAADGALDNVDDPQPAASGERLGAAVAVTFSLEPGQTLQVPFVLSWDLPVMTFPVGKSGPGASWYKRYTAFYGREGTHAWEIAGDALAARDTWRQQIVDWQQPILSDPKRPTWYKTALFNELYFVADGATAWEHGRVGEPDPGADYFGQFSYIECYDYPFYATFDVDFYASFALLELWPRLEERLIRDYANTVPQEDVTMRRVDASGEMAPRKLAGSVPHDLGAPMESPWLQTNAYTFQDVTRWKDLNAKFVLRLYRDAALLKNPALSAELWPAARQAMIYLQTMDRDEDGIPENEGIPDQTYDTWPVKGVSAYSASLWLAALAACEAMAPNKEDAQEYHSRLTRSTAVFEAALWNGAYYNYDASGSAYHDSVMSDQLAGQWYADFFGVKLLPEERVRSALDTIYRLNVRCYGDGDMGAVNGMRPDGTVDVSDMQSQEMWTGTAYGVASFMLNRHLDEQAWATAHGVYRVTYETSGLWFRTPEAFDVEGNYRASMYQRPLAIWAMETALRLRR